MGVYPHISDGALLQNILDLIREGEHLGRTSH